MRISDWSSDAGSSDLLGFDAEELPKLFGADDLAVTRWGTLRVDHRTMMTSLDGVFAAGDIVRGASLVVWAIRDGRDVTDHMHKRSEEHTSELQSLMRISYAVFCLKKKKQHITTN